MGVFKVAAGRYVLSAPVEIRTANITLVGGGADRTAVVIDGAGAEMAGISSVPTSSPT